MIIVRVELHSAISGEITEIGRMSITNDGTGTQSKGNYVIKLFRKGFKSVLKQGTVLDHPRLSTSVWTLVYKALKNTLDPT